MKINLLQSTGSKSRPTTRPKRKRLLKFTAAIGLAAFFGAGYYYYQNRSLDSLTEAAKKLDKVDRKISEVPCKNPIREVKVGDEKRIVTVGEAFNLEVVLSNKLGRECRCVVEIHATTFDVSPPTPQSFILPPKTDYSTFWNMAAKSEGTQEILIHSEKDIIRRGIIVKNALGLTKRQAAILTVLYAFLGSALTLPWLLELWRSRKKDEEKDKHKSSIILPPSYVDTSETRKNHRTPIRSTWVNLLLNMLEALVLILFVILSFVLGVGLIKGTWPFLCWTGGILNLFVIINGFLIGCILVSVPSILIFDVIVHPKTYFIGR